MSVIITSPGAAAILRDPWRCPLCWRSFRWRRRCAPRWSSPGSKSLTNRALVLAALGRGATTLRGRAVERRHPGDGRVPCASWASPSQVDPDPGEPANRTITRGGAGRRHPAGGHPRGAAAIFVGNAGTAARFLTALVCAWGGAATACRACRACTSARRQALFEALRGARLRRSTRRTAGCPPVVHGHRTARPAAPGSASSESSQFASALLLARARRRLAGGACAGSQPGRAAVRRDDPAAWCAAFPAGRRRLRHRARRLERQLLLGGGLAAGPRGRHRRQRVSRCAAGRRSGWQIDAEFPRFLPLPPDAVARARPGRQHHDGDRAGPLRRAPDPLHRPRAAAGAGVRAGRSAAHRAGQVRGAGATRRATP